MVMATAVVVGRTVVGRTVVGRTGAMVPGRTAGLNLFPEIIRHLCEIFLQSQRYGLGRAGQRGSAETRGDGHTQNAA
jgi:hypothetical protein